MSPPPGVVQVLLQVVHRLLLDIQKVVKVSLQVENNITTITMKVKSSKTVEVPYESSDLHNPLNRLY